MRMNDKIRKIRKQMEEEAGQTPPENQIKKIKVKKMVGKTAGASNTTWKRYRKKLKEWDIIEEDDRDPQSFKILSFLEEEQEQQKQIDQQAPKKNVTLRVNKELVNHMDTLNVNKSEFFEQHAMKEFSNIEDKIADMIEYENEEELKFVTELILKDLYRSSKGQEERKQLYKEQFGRWNDFACNKMRQKAFKTAEKLGIINRPEGL